MENGKELVTPLKGRKATTLMIGSEGARLIHENDIEITPLLQTLVKNKLYSYREPQVIINEKAVIFIDCYGDKFISKPHNEDFDEEKGLMMCLLKIKGVTHSQIKRFIEKCGVTKEKALMQEILYVRSGIDNKKLKELLKNAKRQSHKEKAKEDKFVPLKEFEIGKKYKLTIRACKHDNLDICYWVTKVKDVVFTATKKRINDVLGYDVHPKWCEEVKE